jgi:PEP-CTERM motif
MSAFTHTAAAKALTILALSAGAAHAGVIGFEDLTTRNNFNNLGIIDTYQGYEWGYGMTGGLSARNFGNISTGWASASKSRPLDSQVVTAGLTGSSYAWNWNGVQSLWIDFKELSDVDSIDLAQAYLPTSGLRSYNVSTIQLFGYGADNTLLETSSVFSLGSQFKTLTADFEDVRYLEIRSDSTFRWFMLDQLVVSKATNDVPEPASLALMLTAVAGVGIASRRRRSRQA